MNDQISTIRERVSIIIVAARICAPRARAAFCSPTSVIVTPLYCRLSSFAARRDYDSRRRIFSPPQMAQQQARQVPAGAGSGAAGIQREKRGE